jgi:hypothetical protein
MIRDIYIKSPDDPNFQFVYEHSNPIESILAKIRMILNTRQGDVLADLNFGIGIEDYVFETKLNAFELEEKIKTQINEYVSEASQYAITPKVQFGKTEGYDYAVIDIYIDNTRVAGILVK